ncbi:MAG: B12-binding domain-containing radical SAM protein [Chloroflexi bacterium]|nr:B12-binding domain-containing radical SAM protein [Chloroflexota bacterium]
MEILLISTDIDVWVLGLRSISAVLRSAGHNISLVCMTSPEKLFSPSALDELTSLSRTKDIIGVSCLAQGSDKAEQVIEHLRPLGKLIVWGGVHASLFPEECADYADIVCRGEGEGMMLDLVERVAQGQDWRDIENITYKADGVLIRNNARPPIADLDTLPLPDYSFKSEYHLTPQGLEQVSTLPRLKDSGRIIFNGSRGCAFHCTYCCNATLKALYPGKERYVRRMSIPRFIEHAQELKRIFPEGRYFYFIDEDFGARPLNELVQLAEEYPAKVGLPFACLSHPARISREKMDLLVTAGMFQVHMGIESGSEQTRRNIYNRYVSNEVIVRAAEIISHYPQVAPFYFIIYGNPYEEKEDLLTTARLIGSLPPGFFLQAYSLIFFPGSDLYERAVRDGLIKGKSDCGYEMDYLTGLKYKEHAWKKKNLYLNGLISLMDGTCARNHLGFLPRFMLQTLLQPRFIAFNDKHPFIIKHWISLKILYIKARRVVVRLLKNANSNPAMANKILQRKAST